jgi:very-short-patch-repair endonuclease
MIKIVVNGKVESQGKVNQEDLAKFAIKLNNYPPKSEQWFRELYDPFRLTVQFKYDKHNLNKHYNDRLKDKFNQPFQGFIPDIINFSYKYIIEIDGSFHDLERVKFKDKIKDRLNSFMGYKIFRIKAFDLDSWNNFKTEFIEYSIIAINK